ncbi:MAG: tetratricopeptide repeat protein [Acidobacteriota bacterium]
MKSPSSFAPEVVPAASPRSLLAIFLFISGAASITCEVVWFKVLGLHAGADPGTLAATLAGFLGGLGLGGALISRWADRSRFPLRLAAALEGLTALLVAASPSLFPAAIRLFDRFSGPPLLDGSEGVAIKVVSGLLVLLPAICMGGLLPVVVKASVGRPASLGNTTAILYGANTLGGGFGALASGFFFLPSLGIGMTLMTAAAMQMMVALALLFLSWRRSEASPQTAVHPAGGSGSSLRPKILLAYAVAGSAALMAELVWTLVFQTALGSSAYALAAVLAVYLLGLAAGSLMLRARLDRVAQPVHLLGWLQVGAALALLLVIPLLGQLPLWVAPLSARWSSRPLMLLALEVGLAGLLLLPLTLLLGASFPVACRAASRGSAIALPVGWTTLANLTGAMVGIAAGRVAVDGFGLRRTLMVAAGLHAAAGLLVLVQRGARLPRRVPAVAVVVVLAALLVGRSPWDRQLLTSGAYLHGPLFAAGAALGGGTLSQQAHALGNIVFYREASEGVVAVRQAWDGTLSLSVNGRTEASTGADRAAQLWAAHFPGLLATDARRGLVIGLASGMTLRAATRHILERIDCVEISPAVVEAAATFAPATENVLHDPRVNVVLGDARRWLALPGAPYDLIISQPSNPWVAGMSNLYTREFLQRARGRLSPTGLLALWVQAYAFDPEDFRAVLGTFLEVFPDASLWEEALAGGDYFLVGSASGQTPDWQRVAIALERPGVRKDLAPLGIDELGDLLAHWVAGPRGLAEIADASHRITDDNLRLEFTAPLNIQRRSVPEILHLLSKARAHRAELDLSSLDSLTRRRTLDRLVVLEDRRRRDRQVLDLLLAEESVLESEPQLGLAATLLASGWNAAAAEELERLVTRRPDLGLAWLLLGATQLSEPHSAAPAREALAQAAVLRPRDPTAWNLLGRALVMQGEHSAARRTFDRALDLRPRFPEALNNRGALALQEGRPAEALLDLERAVKLEPSSAPLRVNLGLALRRLGRRKDSERIYREGLDLDPENPDLHYNLATLALDQERPQVALEHYRLAAKMGGTDALTERGQGLALLALGRTLEAATHLQRSLILDPEQPDLTRVLRSLTPTPLK